MKIIDRKSLDRKFIQTSSVNVKDITKRDQIDLILNEVRRYIEYEEELSINENHEVLSAEIIVFRTSDFTQVMNAIKSIQNSNLSDKNKLESVLNSLHALNQC